MFQGYDIPLIILAILTCCVISRIIIEFLNCFYDYCLTRLEKRENFNHSIFKLIWFVFSIILLFLIFKLSIFIYLLITQP